MERAERYREGLALWLAGDFAAAASTFSRFADVDPPAGRLLEQSRAMARGPRPEKWTAIFALD